MAIAAVNTSAPPSNAPAQARPAPEAAAESDRTATANRALAGLVRELNNHSAAGENREFSLSIDPKTKQAVIRIVDSQTGKLVEQVPSEYLLKVAQEIGNEIPAVRSKIAALGR